MPGWPSRLCQRKWSSAPVCSTSWKKHWRLFPSLLWIETMQVCWSQMRCTIWSVPCTAELSCMSDIHSLFFVFLHQLWLPRKRTWVSLILWSHWKNPPLPWFLLLRQLTPPSLWTWLSTSESRYSQLTHNLPAIITLHLVQNVFTFQVM